MKIGFTGTQRGMTDAQKERVNVYINNKDTFEFHHGDCIGSDATACDLADVGGKHIVCHPPLNCEKRAFKKYHEIREPLDYLARNREIVKECDLLIATPKGHQEELRSGTWATVRFARHIGKSVIIIYPDGSERGYP